MQTGHLAIGLAVIVSVVPASFAQDSRVLDPGKPAATAIEAKKREAHQRPGSNPGISLAVPTGEVSVDPEFVDGEPIYVRRMTEKGGMAVVEVSTTPFMPVLPGVGELAGSPAEQPASW